MECKLHIFKVQMQTVIDEGGKDTSFGAVTDNPCILLQKYFSNITINNPKETPLVVVTVDGEGCWEEA